MRRHRTARCPWEMGGQLRWSEDPLLGLPGLELCRTHSRLHPACTDLEVQLFSVPEFSLILFDLPLGSRGGGCEGCKDAERDP